MAKTARKRRRVKPGKARARARSVRRPQAGLQRPLRVSVRAPKVHITTPAPQVSVSAPVPAVQVEAPSVSIQAPKPIVIPAPIVQVEVEVEERVEEASIKGLRKELKKCMNQNQTIELLLESDWGANSSRYRVGSLVRVEDGLVELRPSASLAAHANSILIPLHRIVAVIPYLQPAATVARADELGEPEDQEVLYLHWNEDGEDTADPQPASG